MNDILKYFPEKIEKKIATEALDKMDSLEEIRLRAEKPIILKFNGFEKIIKYTVTGYEILSSLQTICENSIYTYQNQIAEGFITVKGGHRVGISGDVVIEDEKVKSISYIYSLNFRIAKQIKDASINLLKHVINMSNNSIYNTLIVGAPGTGKTTILKDLINKISNGFEGFKRNNS